MTAAAHWFDVDARGFAKLIERRGWPGGGKLALLHELIANAWDAAGTTRVEISLEVVPNAPRTRVVVSDDAPDGFSDLSHAWTMFAESPRKSDPKTLTKKALFSADGKDSWVPRENWTPAMQRVVTYANRVAGALLERPQGVLVSILCDVTLDWAACFGDTGLVFNLGRLGHAFFEACARGPTRKLNCLLVHELGHGMPGGDNHLDEAYHRGLCDLAARLAELALDQPSLFRWDEGRAS